MSLIAIIYVGKKPHAFDNVARSGKSWAGNGDVQEVTAAQAKLLLKYPDQWELADPEDQAAVDEPTTLTVTGADGKDEQVDQADLAKPVEKMTKPELVAYAKQRFDKDIDIALSKKTLLDMIAEFAQTVEPMLGSQAAV